jgi:hypothetical protein
MRRKAHKRRQSRQGYVLLMTLVLIVIAVLCLAGLARRSLQLALDAKEAQDELQCRWLALSCREMLLDRAEEQFIEAEDAVDRRSQWPASKEFSAAFSMAGMQARVVLGDEDAKLNLNSLYARRPDDVRPLLIRYAGGSLAPKLAPDVRPEAKRRKRQFASWGQVFDLAAAFSQGHGAEFLQATSDLTCWGDGKPNIRRSSNRALQEAVSLALNREVAGKLVTARADFECDLLLPELLAKLELRRTDQMKLRSALSDRSSCYSLWLELETPRRRWYYLWIQGDSAAGTGGRVQSFCW